MAASGATPIILYHSTTAAAVPSNTNLAAGELGLNIADMKLYCENDSAVVTLLASADAAAGNFTTVDTTNLEVTNIKAKDGTASATITDSTGAFTISTELSVDNININGNTIVSSDTDGDLNLTPNGTGDLVLDGLNWPQADGTADYVLKTDGSGQLSWTAQTGGGGGGTSVTVTQATATAAQTDFSVTYTVGQLSVYLNGALLASGDFTASNGTTVVLASGAAANDIFTAVAYSTVAGLEIDSATPYLTAVGSGAGAVTTGVNNTFVGFEAGNDTDTGANNTAVGYQALDVNTGGTSNTAIGNLTLTSNISGNNNTALGQRALELNTASNITGLGAFALSFNTTGANNTAVGYLALESNTTGSNNTAVGYAALDANTTGVSNTAVGSGALGVNTTGVENTAVGAYALDANTTGTLNTAVGHDALSANTTGTQNSAFGQAALQTSTTGSFNTAIGRAALFENTTGANNTAVGYAALLDNTIGTNNTAVGSNALLANTIGANNTAVGHGALDSCTTGANNTAVGSGQCLGALTTGTTNTAVGASAGLSVTTGSNNLLLGLDAGRSNSPSGLITTGSNNVVLGDNSIANLYCADTTISSSDARDKTDVQDFTHGLDWITQLRPVTYRWDKRSWYAGGNCQTEDIINAQPNGAKKRQQLHLGFLAQEELAVETQFGFGTSKDNMLIANLNEDESAYGLKYERLVPILVNAIKELKAEVDALKSQINGA